MCLLIRVVNLWFPTGRDPLSHTILSRFWLLKLWYLIFFSNTLHERLVMNSGKDWTCNYSCPLTYLWFRESRKGTFFWAKESSLFVFGRCSASSLHPRFFSSDMGSISKGNSMHIYISFLASLSQSQRCFQVTGIVASDFIWFLLSFTIEIYVDMVEVSFSLNCFGYFDTSL